MEAIQFTLEDKTLKHCTIPQPTIADPKHVLVRVAYAGICGTDLHIIQGEFPCNPTEPVVLGHEFSGTILKVGDKVTAFRQGDKVSIDPNMGCHKCRYCRDGKPHFCETAGKDTILGIYKDGGWAEYVVCPESQVFKIPEGISLRQAALCEPISCISHGWDLASPIKVGKEILITGAGIIGNLYACLLHLHGHRKVTITEPNKIRLDNLTKLNLDYTLITPDQLEKDKLFDYVIDCSGDPTAIENGISLLNRGGKMIVFGVTQPDAEISIKPFEIYFKELTIIGVKINPFSFPNSIGFMEAMGDRYLNYDSLGIRAYALKDYAEAIEALKEGSITKAMFNMTKCGCP